MFFKVTKVVVTEKVSVIQAKNATDAAKHFNIGNFAKGKTTIQSVKIETLADNIEEIDTDGCGIVDTPAMAEVN